MVDGAKSVMRSSDPFIRHHKADHTQTSMTTLQLRRWEETDNGSMVEKSKVGTYGLCETC